MKTKIITTNGIRPREIEVPEDWVEAHAMLYATQNSYYDRRGGNLERLSVAARVAYGMFPGFRDPTDALVGVLLKLIDEEGFHA